jgi:methylated-DNA-[protein]-cysteine S-methyltransferase
MKTCYIQTPLGIATIIGDVEGVSEISIAKAEIKVSDIPEELENCVKQLEEYFAGKRQVFDFKTNQKGTEFQQKVWSKLGEIPF